jgi:UPF0176 protein
LTSRCRLRDVGDMSSPVTIAAFYKFAPVAKPAALRDLLAERAAALEIKGIVLVAPEGLNGTIAAEQNQVETFLSFISMIDGFSEIDVKQSQSTRRPFRRLRVRLKKEIVTFGQPQADPNLQVGTYVAPSDWNALIADPDVVLIDTRNSYEVGFGTFDGAIDPGTRHFSEFADYVRQNMDPAKHRKVAMFCTGGIRCEKASSFMKAEGFDEVYHLKGGILKYLEEIDPAQSRWQGGCFVFDERVSVGHGVAPLSQLLCLSCNSFVSDAATKQPGYEEGVSCPSCVGLLTMDQLRSARERQRQIVRDRQSLVLPEKRRGKPAAS